MNFKKEIIRNCYLYDTAVENVFINEYLTNAPGDHVKVYLLALMYAEAGTVMDNGTIARQLSLTLEDVLSAWSYWEGKGVVRRHYKDRQDALRFHVEFINLKEQIYGHPGNSDKRNEIPSELAGIMDDKDLKNAYNKIEQVTGRLLGGKEPAAILSWVNDYGISLDLAIFAYEYCMKYRKNSRYNYVNAVVKEWASKNLHTLNQVEAYLLENDKRHNLYKRVLKALGFSRNATEEEKRIMDTWFDDMKHDINRVLEACKKTSGISNPNINYINSVLSAWSREDGQMRHDTPPKDSNPISLVMDSYEKEREKRTAESEARREEVYKRVPRIREIEEEMRTAGMEIAKRMLSGGSGARNRIRELKNKTDRLNQEKAYLLTDNNFEINYMEIWYNCSKCKDTGLLDSGERCPCFSVKLDQLGFEDPLSNT